MSGLRIEELSAADGDVLALLVELALDEQEHYDHPTETRAEIEERLHAPPTFVGRNRVLVARDSDGAACGVCWVILFDPGTGLEAEIAQLYVRRERRGAGVARRLVAAAVQVLRDEHVTFASVWSRDANQAALAAYRAAGFAPTQQTVLTWLPLPDG
ncbi:MAG: GNAT family N-acetyltransferase [Candidatus Dormibacteria bacterium]